MRLILRCLKREHKWHRSFSQSARQCIVKDIRELPARQIPSYQPTNHHDLLSLQWASPPRNVLLTKKDKAPEVTAALIEFAKHIHTTYPSISLIFEPDTAYSLASALPFPIFAPHPQAQDLAGSAASGAAGSPSVGLPDKVDLACTFGGDGTILHAASLFATRRSVPPILSFSMGTLGFLGEWKFGEHKRAFRDVVVSGATTAVAGWGRHAGAAGEEGDGAAAVASTAVAAAADVQQQRQRPDVEADAEQQEEAVKGKAGGKGWVQKEKKSGAGPTGWSSIRGRSMGRGRGARVLLRNRLKVGVFAPDGSRISPSAHPESATMGLATGEGRAGDVYAMNEVIIHRGRDPHLAVVDVFVGGRYLTEAVADGMIISTPTGSTAYSLSSGGSIVHPLVSSLLLTPICPRSLSFRPLVLPANTPITLRLSEKNRGREVEISVDGVRRSEGMGVGMEVRVQGEEIQDHQGAWVGGVPSIVRGTVGSEGTGDDHWVGGLNGLLKFNYPFGEDG